MFKSFLTAKTHYVMWVGKESPQGQTYAWIVNEDSDYGWFSLASSPFWRHTTPVEPKKGVTRNVKQFDADGEPILDEAGKQVTVKVEYAPVHEKVFKNDSWAVGDRMSVRQGNHYEVIAVHSRGILMREAETGMVFPESNSDLKKYYKKEENW